MKKTNFTIIIPTFNRTQELLYNLKLLSDISDELGLDYPIIIGDDGSACSHQDAIEQYIQIARMNITYYRNAENLGIEGNELKLVSMVKTDYALLLGEDDYLNAKLMKRIHYYTQIGDVNVIIPNFYGINKEMEQLRTPRFSIRNDFLIQKGDVKYFCYAGQMSGLTFKTANVCEEYRKRGITGNSYPQMFFIAYNLETGSGVHITKHPFQNTVLKKKQFDYSVDNLLHDLLLIIHSLKLTENQKNEVTAFVLKNEMIRYANAYTWTHPKCLLKKIDQYGSEIDTWTRKKIKHEFIKSYFIAPIIVVKHYWVRRKHYKNKVS